MAITPESGNTSRNRGLFHDPEVGTEAHDDILAWVASKSGQKQIIETLLTVTTNDHWWQTSTLQNDHPHYKLLPGNKHTYTPVPGALWRPLRQTNEVKLERPLSARNGYIVGFADAVLTSSTEYEFEGIISINRPYNGSTVTEVREVLTGLTGARVLIEVKTGRLQLGEVLRQLNTYASTGNFSHRLLIVKQRPPAHYVEALEGEKIQVALFSDYELEWLTAVN